MEVVYNPSTLDYMYRYLEKYVGKYRVMAYIDEDTNCFPKDDSYEDFYIPCSQCVIKHTYIGNDVLALCFYDKYTSAKNISKKLTDLGIEHEDDISELCTDAHIFFKAKDISQVAKLVKAKTNGKQIHPLSARNLKKVKTSAYKIPEKELEKLYKNVEGMTRTEKLQFFRKVNKEYIDKLDKETKKNNREEMKFNGLGTKEYIHSIGYWDKYVRFVNRKLKK